MSPEVFRTIAEVHRFVAGAQRVGRRLALVPTMGALHDGHLALMRAAAAKTDLVVASIFVNPTQFGPKEDLSRYPRDLDGDLAKCASAGVVQVFAPAESEMYPPGFQTFVEVDKVSLGLCGVKRPGHFRGVATVVCKLFALFQPTWAVFGEKDYQQLQVIRAMARDLGFPVEVLGVPIVRDADGLAMSSRNVYLSPEDRAAGLAIPRALHAMREAARSGEQEVEALVKAARGALSAAGLRDDYVEVVDAQTLASLRRVTPNRPARALIAAFAGPVRLIDNIAL